MDPITWPPQVLTLAAAIAKAEGSNPEWNNPGDLTYSFGLYTVGLANREGVLKFATIEDGEYALRHQCWLMLTGRSYVYRLTDTLVQVAVKYADGDLNWAKNVATCLNVPTSTTLGELAA